MAREDGQMKAKMQRKSAGEMGNRSGGNQGAPAAACIMANK